MQVGHLGLPRLALTERPVPSHGAILSLIVAVLAAARSEVGTSIRRRLEADSRVEALNGKMIGTGTGASRFDLDQLVSWWIWRANEVGQETANSNLEIFLNGNEIVTLQALWVYGVTSTKTQTVFPGVDLVPAKEMPASYEQEEFLASSFNPFGGRGPVPQAALVSRISIPKINPSDDSSVRNDDVWEKHKLLQDIALLMNCLSDTMCFAGLTTSYCPPEVPLGFFGGGGGGRSLKDVLPFRSVVVKDEEIPVLERVVKSYRGLPEASRSRLSRALQRLSLAKGRLEPGDKALDLGIALEMALLDNRSDHDFPGQLHVQFRLRGSWLVGVTPDDRKELFKTLGEIYKHRSQVAHTGIARSIEKKGAGKGEMFKQHFKTAERIFVRLVERDFPSDSAWIEMLLGASPK
jgi:hypothetical protein